MAWFTRPTGVSEEVARTAIRRAEVISWRAV
jgi:hypothetical protein